MALFEKKFEKIERANIPISIPGANGLRWDQLRRSGSLIFILRNSDGASRRL